MGSSARRTRGEGGAGRCGDRRENAVGRAWGEVERGEGRSWRRARGGELAGAEGGGGLLKAGVREGVIDGGVGERGVWIGGEGVEGGGIAAEQEVEEAIAEAGVVGEGELTGEAKLAGDVACVAEGVGGLAEEDGAGFGSEALREGFERLGKGNEVEALAFELGIGG